MMLARADSEDQLIFDDCSSIDTTTSRRLQLSPGDARMTSSALAGGIANLTFVGSGGRRRSLDEQSCSSGSGSDYSSGG